MVTGHHVEVGLGSSICELKTSGGSVMGRPACKATSEDLQVKCCGPCGLHRGH